VVVLAVPGNAVAELVASLGDALSGLLVVDATNRINEGSGHNHDAVSAIPGARYARAFNSVGFESMRDPVIDGVAIDMVYACAEQDRPALTALIAAVGARPVWAGEQGWAVCDAALHLWLGLSRSLGRQLGIRVLAPGL
jgi:predicted dinucleotide-binding enzyme